MCDKADPSPKTPTADSTNVTIKLEPARENSVLATDELVLAPDGDLELVFGPDKKVIRVHAWLLKNFCPTLNCNVTEPVRKGEIGCEQRPKLELHKDLARPLTLLCGIIHGRQVTEPNELLASDLLKLAQMARKFGCTDKLFYGAEYWLLHVPFEDAHDLWYGLLAAYLFRNSYHFQRFSNKLTAVVTESFLPFSRKCPTGVPGIKLCYALEEKRSSDRSRVGKGGVLCLDCFGRATASFEPNPGCGSCMSVHWSNPQTLDVLSKTQDDNEPSLASKGGNENAIGPGNPPASTPADPVAASQPNGTQQHDTSGRWSKRGRKWRY